MAGAVVPAEKYASEVGHPSLLLIQSAADTCNPIRQGTQLYRDVRQPNKWYLELTSAHHLPPFDGVDQSAFSEVGTVSTRFLESSPARSDSHAGSDDVRQSQSLGGENVRQPDGSNAAWRSHPRRRVRNHVVLLRAHLPDRTTRDFSSSRTADAPTNGHCAKSDCESRTT